MGNTACVSNLCSKDICDDIDPKKSCSATSASRQQHQVAHEKSTTSATTTAAVSREKEQDYPIDMDMARDRLGQWGTASGEHVVPSNTSGLARMRTPGLNKGMAFTREERQTLGIHGLLPPRVRTLEQQVAFCLQYLETLDDSLTKFVYLMGILERNEKLFFACFATDVEACLPLVYTPAVGLACQKYGLIYRRPRGLFITIHDMGHVYDILKNWPESDVRAIVVTDGQRILGLGDLGANGMGIPIGKLALYTALAGIKPHQTLPITLDVGTNTQSLLDDPTYLGLNQKRVSGEKYDEFLDEFMRSVVKRWGANCLIQFEDFGNANAFRLIEKYRDSYCTFNDDIQGTAAVAVAGLFASLRLTKIKLSDNVIVFQGAGEASLGIANLCVMAMVAEGTDEEEARGKIWMVDSKGLIVKDRPEGGITGHKVRYAHAHAPIRNLDEVVRTFKPTILIGAAAIGGAFTKEILEEMANNNEKPVIFALSNPTIKAECTAEEAYTYTDGRAIFASGSPFLPFTYKGKVHKTGQGNNSYIFPGIALATICAGIKTIPEELFLTAAESLANLVKDSDLEQGSLYPPLADIQKVSILVAVAICEYAYKVGLASVQPQPKNSEQFIIDQMYDHTYKTATNPIYEYPKDS